jgi:hypothetical protein
MCRSAAPMRIAKRRSERELSSTAYQAWDGVALYDPNSEEAKQASGQGV